MDSKQTTLQPELFVEALAVLMSWRRIGKFSSRVCYRIGVGEALTTVMLIADPMRLTYTITSKDGEVREECDGFNHTLSHDGQMEVLQVENLVYEAYAARLAFPLSLPIWGRSFDDYRLTGEANRATDGIELQLVHARDSRLRGTLTVSVPLRMAVRLDTPTVFVGYVDNQQPASSIR